MQDDISMLMTIERYLSGQMLPDEKAYFEQLRKNTPEIDQMVVEHSMFLEEMGNFSKRSTFKHDLHKVHEKLLATGEIKEGNESGIMAKTVAFYQRYKRDFAIAASVGGAIAFVTSALFGYFSPAPGNEKIQQLSIEFAAIKKNQQVQSSIINEVKGKLPKNASLISGGTGFLIDPKGWIVTNAHVLKGNSALVANAKGEEYSASIAYIDKKYDLAILKIVDDEFKPGKTLPYSLEKGDVDLGEEVFSLGFPKKDITYNQGFLSSETGLEGDSVSYQIQLNSNPGYSGAPIFNNAGEIIGILTSKQTQADGVTFAIKSEKLYSMIEEIKKSDSSLQKIKIPTANVLKNKGRKLQIKKIEGCVYSVKAYNKS